MEKECRLKTNSEIELIVNKAINFLAPYFEMNVNNERLGEIDFPKVCIATKAHYNNINKFTRILVREMVSLSRQKRTTHIQSFLFPETNVSGSFNSKGIKDNEKY